MSGQKFSSLFATVAVSLGVACAALLAGAGSALACVAGPTDNGCVRTTYHVQRTDGSLTEWNGPGTDGIAGSLSGNGTAVQVVCQTTGPTEDGLPYIVWDKLDDGHYVYDYYVDTPGDGYTPVLALCPVSGGGTHPSPPPPQGGQPMAPNKFNAAGAAAWARANATSNPIFANNGYSDDCTDFVSRAMRFGGGMPERNVEGSLPGNRTDDRNWYMLPLGLGHLVASYSWSSAPHLLNFLRKAGLTRQVTLQAARPGDLIFVHWGPGGTDADPPGIDHVGMIIRNPGAQGGYDVQIAQHSNNKIENLSDWRHNDPNLQYRIYSIYYH